MHTSPQFRRRCRPLWCLSMLAVAATACGRSATPVDPVQGRASGSGTQTAAEQAAAAQNTRQGFFYPLEVGNRWSYEHAITLFTIPVGGPPGPAFGSSDRRDRVLVCLEQRSGRSYVVEQNGLPATPAWWLRYRQDGAGLYEVDGDLTLPPTCSGATARVFATGARPGQPGEASWTALAATLPGPQEQVAYRAAWARLQTRAAAIRQVIGAAPRVRAGASLEGVEPGELTRLAYPLHPGTHWVIREDPRFEATVEAAESLDLPPGHMHAWRIRIDSEFLGPNDHVHVWYGRNGLLKFAAHFEGEATDPDGNVIGTVVADETEDLLELSLGGELPTP